jgi:general secretion pathway protein C
MVSRLAAFVIWGAVAASMVFWAMRLWVKPTAVPAHTTMVSTANAFKGDLTRLFGPDPAPEVVAAAPARAAPVDARFRLIGVVAPRATAAKAEGLALIATDGKPPKAYRVGSAVDGELVLLAVHSRGASLGPRGQAAMVDLQLPALPAPATGAPTAMGTLPQPGRAMPSLPSRPVQPTGQPPGEQSVVAPPESPGRTVDEALERPVTTPSPGMSPGMSPGASPTTSPSIGRTRQPM